MHYLIPVKAHHSWSLRCFKMHSLIYSNLHLILDTIYLVANAHPKQTPTAQQAVWGRLRFCQVSCSSEALLKRQLTAKHRLPFAKCCRASCDDRNTEVVEDVGWQVAGGERSWQAQRWHRGWSRDWIRKVKVADLKKACPWYMLKVSLTVKHPAPLHAHAMLLPRMLCLAMKSLTFLLSSWCIQGWNVGYFHLPKCWQSSSHY